MSKHRDCRSSVVQIIAVLKNFNQEIWPLFRVACSVNIWCLFLPEQLVIPPKVVDSVELVLEGDDHLLEQKRLPGENNVCCKN